MTTGSFTEYAAHIGASAPYVSKLKKQGRLVTREENGKTVVDFELSDRLIRNTTDMGRARNGANAQPGREASAPVAPIADAGRVDAIFRQAQAQERAFNAKIAELQYRKASGELVSIAEIEAVHARHAALFREALLQMSTRITPIIAGYGGDEAKIRALIDQEHRQALTQFAGGTDGRA